MFYFWKQKPATNLPKSKKLVKIAKVPTCTDKTLSSGFLEKKWISCALINIFLSLIPLFFQPLECLLYFLNHAIFQLNTLTISCYFCVSRAYPEISRLIQSTLQNVHNEIKQLQLLYSENLCGTRLYNQK